MVAALQGFLRARIFGVVRWFKKIVIINSILVHDRTGNMGLPGVSQYRSKRTKREPLAFLTKTRNTSTTKPNLADRCSFHLYRIHNFISPRIKRSLFIAEVGGSTCYFLWCGVRLTKKIKMNLRIPPSLVRSRDHFDSRNQKFGRLSPSHGHIINDFGIRHIHLGLSHLAKESPRDHLHV